MALLYPAIIPVIKDSERTYFDARLAERPLLQWAIESARSNDRRVIVRTVDNKAANLARALGADVETPSAAGREPHFLVSLHYPFRRAQHFEQLANAGAASAVTVSRQRHHPVGVFVAKDGRMNFKATLDSAEWRNLDERQFFQPAENLSLHFAPGQTRRAYFLLDEISAFGVFDARDIAMAALIFERKIFNPSDGGTPWKRL